MHYHYNASHREWVDWGEMVRTGEMLQCLPPYSDGKFFDDIVGLAQNCSNSRAFPGSKVHGANMGPIWGRQDPGGRHVGPMNFAIWVSNGVTTVWLSHWYLLWWFFFVLFHCSLFDVCYFFHLEALVLDDRYFDVFFLFQEIDISIKWTQVTTSVW